MLDHRGLRSGYGRPFSDLYETSCLCCGAPAFAMDLGGMRSGSCSDDVCGGWMDGLTRDVVERFGVDKLVRAKLMAAPRPAELVRTDDAITVGPDA